MTDEHQRAAAIEAPSGTEIMQSTTFGRNDGSTRGRPIPSIREPEPVAEGSFSLQPWKNAEFSGSTTQSRVSCRR